MARKPALPVPPALPARPALGHEDPLDHCRRGRDVLRELFPGQRARRRAPGSRARGHAASALHADPHRRGQRQPESGVVWRDQRLHAAASGAVPEHAALPGSVVGLAAGHQRVRQPVNFHRPEAARRSHDFDARGAARRAPKGVRQAARLADGRTGSRCRQSAELDAHRPGAAARRHAEAAGLLHAARRGSLSRRSVGTVSRTRVSN